MITIDRIIYKKCFREIVQKILEAYADRKGDFIGEVLFVSKIIIDEGDNGIKTYEGLFNNEIHVAVKCIPQDAQQLRSKVNWMGIPKHPNLINCFIVMEHQKCWYVALERCYFNLRQLMEMCKTKKKSIWTEKWEGRPTSGLMRIISGVVAGVSHLHRKGFVHTYLNPSHILIVNDEETDEGVEFSAIPKITSLDACKTMTSLGSNAITGNRGWRAAEIIEGSKRLTPEIDSFSLGCLLFFCLCKGRHPFGEDIDVKQQERNIKHNYPKNLHMVEYFCEAHDLISSLLKHDPKSRLPLVKDMYSHPIFWDGPKRAKFMRDVYEWQGSNSNISNQLNKATSMVFQQGNCDWSLMLVGEISENVKREIGNTPNEVYEYFRETFPKIFIEVYLVVKKGCTNEPRFREYFTNPLS